MFRKSLYIMLALVMTSSAVLAGCGQKAENTNTGNNEANKQEPVKVTFWDENAGPNRTPYYEELIKRFEAKNSNIKIEYVGIPWANAKQKYDTAIAANEVPDCGGGVPIWIANFAQKNATIPLDSYFDKWSEKSKIPTSVIDGIRANVTDKKLYLLPNTSTMATYWYRSDWFKEAGLQPPQTWDEFFKDIELMTDKNAKRFGYSIRGGAGGSSQLMDLLYGYSGITEFFDKNGKSTLDDPKHIEVLNKYVAIYNKFTPQSDISNGYKEMVAAFDTGTVAMIQHNLGSYGEHSKTLGEGKFAAFATPKGASGKRVILAANNANGYSIFKNSKNPDAAWEFISFLSSKESQSYWNQNIGQMPVHSDVVNEDWVKKAQHISVSLDQIADKDTVLISVPSYLADWQSILDKIGTPGLQAVLAGKRTAADLLKEMADAATKAQAEYMKNNK